MQEKRLSDYAVEAFECTLGNALSHTFGYATGFVFGLSAITAIGSWSAYMGATIAGSIALYIPLLLIHKGLQRRDGSIISLMIF